ncbi:P-loop containing nucleoside triphosphate hydrolase protein [Pluteus cervinus]|uniref:P-loop containing nucleoside triphosphate hydrolase protein n=1 Tax=Pluteus cervinus TaxID=181527 RepID=A0ACD3B7N6_9AGAR|nr:P-loop containing nucleoside triphosphate hydrolase protein [Pluteus cervinus]
MAGKRTVTVESDNESVPDATPPPKRARNRQEGNDTAQEATQSRSKKGKGKARQKQDDDEEEDEEVNQDDDEAEEEFENQNSERIRAAIEGRRKSSGGIADHGIIESIEMHQFMCHKYLQFSFGPQINFIIGHNGSGKSAVLSAITVALGGKATSTGRGSGLKSFIREGQHVSEVSISLKNKGEEAYKPQEYGHSIVITRRFTKDGSSSWKIKSKDNRVVSTKKEELAAICDHMNIQVDNPMNVLTQDAARQFLSASHPSDKYKFFLRGTQLSQLSEEYDTCLENITQTNRILGQKKEALPDLRNALQEATAKFQEAAKAREQKAKVDNLKKELAWAHVNKKQEEMTKKFEEVAKLTKRIPKIEESLAAAQVTFDEATAKVTRFEAEYLQLGDPENLNNEKKRLTEDMRSNKIKLTKCRDEQKDMQESIKRLNANIEGLQKSIEEETRRMATHSQAKRDESQRKLDIAQKSLDTAEAEFKEHEAKKRDLSANCDGIKNRAQELLAVIDGHKKKVDESNAMIDRSKESEKNSLAPFGRDIRGVLDAVSKMNWHGDKPLGPLGAYVKAKDPEKWGEILRNQLRNYLTAFALTDARDRPQLKALLERSGNHQVQIIIFEKDLFDYSEGEPRENFLTVLRALNISDPYVLRILINQARIESQLLAESRREGENKLRLLRHGGSAWTADGFNVRVYPEGGTYSTPLTIRQARDATSLLLTGRDAQAEIRHFTQELNQANAQLADVNRQYSEFKEKWSQENNALQELIRKEPRMKETIRKCKNEVNTLRQEANEDLPAGVSGLEDAKREAEGEKELALALFRGSREVQAGIDDEQKTLMTKVNGIRTQIAEYDSRMLEMRKHVEDAAAGRAHAQNSVNHFQKKLEEETEALNQQKEVANVLQEEFENWSLKAEEYCERVETDRKPDEVQRNLESVQKALKEREKKHGASVEEMTIEVNKAKARHDAAERDLKQMISLNKALRASLIKRLARWQEFRRHIALRCKYEFQYHLSHRGYFGKVLFDHKNGTLQLKVKTDDQIATQGSRDKDPRSLSGGEKSFSTICLLLSLWEAIGCPLRCLDEFDVFMDAVNRRISMKMMIDTAKSSDKKQYILITPQDMTNITVGKEVRVHRMTDPERGQGTLSFTA